MKVLNLVTRQVTIDEILAGTKTQEYRQVRPTTEARYFLAKEGADVYETDEDGCPSTIKYDAIRFYEGDNKMCNSILVEVKDSYFQLITDENGNYPIFEKMLIGGKESDYPVCQVVYDLGKVLEVSVN